MSIFFAPKTSSDRLYCLLFKLIEQNFWVPPPQTGKVFKEWVRISWKATLVPGICFYILLASSEHENCYCMGLWITVWGGSEISCQIYLPLSKYLTCFLLIVLHYSFMRNFWGRLSNHSELSFFLPLIFLSSKIGSPPKTPVSNAAATSTGPSNFGTELSSVPPKSSPFLTRVPVYPQHSESIQYFQDPRTQIPFEVPQYPQTGK